MARRGKCPICGARPTAEHAPFCSRHCADVDLGNWIGGRYRIPTEDEPEDGVEPEPEERSRLN